MLVTSDFNFELLLTAVNFKGCQVVIFVKAVGAHLLSRLVLIKIVNFLLF